MAQRENYRKLTRKERQNRYFSTEFKKKRVEEIERNIASVSEISREYQVTAAAIYKWLYKYSPYRQKGAKQVIEAESDTRQIQELKSEVKALQHSVGEKQIKIDFLEQLLNEVEKNYGIDIKKNFSTKRSSGSGSTEKNTHTK